MSEYREIEGQAVQNIAGSTGTIEGQLYYDTSADQFKYIDNTGAKTITSS